MKSLQRVIGRLLRGEDVVIVSQSKERWDAQFKKGAWDRLTGGMPHTAFLAGLILDAFPDGAKVLDVGCGNGGLAKLLVGKSGMHYVGTDLSDTGIEQARKLVPNATFLAQEAMKPPAEAADCNVLVLSDVVYYFDSQEVIPRYAAVMPKDTLVLVSITRCWRSPFLWHRLKKDLSFVSEYQVSGMGGKHHTWDIVAARFR
jgi:SAM-dependent methyltransferase